MLEFKCTVAVLKCTTVGLLTVSGLAFGAGDHPGHGTHWGYEGDVGPDRWMLLQPDFSSCAGRNQSPINVAEPIEAEMPPLRIDYNLGGHEVENNGHTIQVSFEEGSSIMLDGIKFDLKQFHFHSPSENHINGKAFPLEAHLVHADKDGNLAVVAVLFLEGKANSTISAAWNRLPQAEVKNPLPSKISARGLLPKERDYYRYNGSLTTPPCTEGVRWIVMKKMLTASREQISAFQTTLGFANNRPIQSRNARTILK